MGLFSSKTKHYVSTEVVRVVEDNQIPQSRKTTTLTSILRNENLVTEYLEYGLSGGFRGFERMYHSAKKGDYYYGLPNAKLLTSQGARNPVQAVIESLISQPVAELTYAHFAPLNHLHMGWVNAYSTYGYDPATNELSSLSTAKGTPVYLENIIARHRIEVGNEPERGSLQRFEGCDYPTAGYTPIRLGQTTTDLQQLAADEVWYEGPDEVDSVELHFIWEEESTVTTELPTTELALDSEGNIITVPMTTTEVVKTLHRSIATINLSSFDADKEYYHARYTYTQADKTFIGYWFYDTADGRYPDLDQHFDNTPTEPGTYFPFVAFQSNKINRTQGDARRSIQFKSTEKLLKKIKLDFGSIGDQLSEQEIEDMEQIIMLMGVPMTTEDPMELQYLFEFFQNLYLQTRENTHTAYNTEQYSMSISDADFTLIVAVKGITSSIRAGNIGKVGKVIRVIADVSNVENEPGAFGGRFTEISNRSTRGVGSKITLQRQISPHAIQEMVLDAPTYRYNIYGDRGVGGGAADDKMLIPLDYEIMRKVPFLDREYVYYRSMHFLFNSRITIKGSFLASIGFKIILAVIAVIMALPTGGGSLTWYAAIAAMGWVGFVKFIVVMYLKQVIIGYAIRILAKALGPRYTLILALVAVVFSAASSQGLLVDIVSEATAQNLLQMSLSLVEVAATPTEGIAQYQSEAAAWEEERESLSDELSRLSDLLNTNQLLDPMTFVSTQPLTVFGESPESYFERTIHAGNVGTVGFEIIENFVEISLRLPDINMTTGDTFA